MIDGKNLIEKLEMLRFFNQRAGRELWQDKQKEVQDIDIENADEILSSAIEALKKCEWIPVSERLPEEYGCYLVAWKTVPMISKTGEHFYEIVEFDPDDEALWIGCIEQTGGLEYEIIAWQPLPKPYKGGEE